MKNTEPKRINIMNDIIEHINIHYDFTDKTNEDNIISIKMKEIEKPIEVRMQHPNWYDWTLEDVCTLFETTTFAHIRDKCSKVLDYREVNEE